MMVNICFLLSLDLNDLPGLTRQDSKDSLSSDHSNKDENDEQWVAHVSINTGYTKC